MNSISSSSLFHFTKKYDTLERIMIDGLRFSFSYEQISSKAIVNFDYPDAINDKEEFYRGTGVAIPMISFCDIPITRSQEHIEKYGEYIIGLDKKFMIKNFNDIINPIMYVKSRNVSDFFDNISKVYSESYQKTIHSISSIQKNEPFNLSDFKIQGRNNAERRFLLNFIIGLIKPCYDLSPETDYYDEREWRAILPDSSISNSSWIWGINKKYYDNIRNEINNALSKSKYGFLSIPKETITDAITHIVVKTESERCSILNIIMNSKNIFGAQLNKNDRLILVSKINSLEKINQDY